MWMVALQQDNKWIYGLLLVMVTLKFVIYISIYIIICETEKNLN